MKKVLMVAAMLFAGLFTYCYGQDVKVNINNQDYSSNKDCEYKINGICSSEDIGGVDFEVKTEGYHVSLVLTNYNSFPVTVLIEYNSDYRQTKAVVLGVNGVKVVDENQCGTHYKLVGMIVRKLAQ